MRLAAGVPTWQPVAVADTTAFTDNGHLSIQGGTSTQRSEVLEVYMGGLAAASAVMLMQLGRDSTVGATLTAGRLAPTDASAVLIANPPVAFQASTTKPQRSSTLGMLLSLAFNAFGGVVRWYRGPEQIVSIVGNTASLGEISLSGFTGTAATTSITSNITIETF